MTRHAGRAGERGLLAFALLAVCACADSAASTAAGDAKLSAAEERLVKNEAPQHALQIRDMQSAKNAIVLFSADQLELAIGDRVSVAVAGKTLHVRSVREFSLAAVAADAPLIERTDQNGAPLSGWGSVRATDAGFLGELLNTGWVAALDDGGALFAYALDPEVIRFDAKGRVVWRSVRSTPSPYGQPVLVRDGSSIRPDFTEVQHGIATGPDGRLYILAGATRDSMRIDVLDDNGAFVRAGWVPRGRDVVVDKRGRVFIGNEPEESPPSARVAYPDFDLAAINGAERVRLSDYRGKSVVINVWASWCAPCRLEMPALDSLAAEIDTAMVVIVGLNDDEDLAAAHRFVKSLGGVGYPLAAGGGRLRERLGYRGLPYTIVLDREHRVVDEIHGFGGDIDLIRGAIETALTARDRE